MIILTIDASLSGCSVGLYDSAADKIIAEKISHDDMKQAEQLAPMVESVWQDRCAIDAVAVTIGAGSFTGIRIALSFAKSFAFGIGANIIGVNTFDVAHIAHGNDKTFLIDTKRGDFYAREVGGEIVIVTPDNKPKNAKLIERLEPINIARAALLYPSPAEPIYVREPEVSTSKTTPPRIVSA